ncbi:pentatricopeptide repeat-containing protein At3g18110, chloroplastic-like [Ipomoea triloba]|uniref:pentatricopeptide repeat-containing protein At3g18110, chloroplastic-like n=1 Tax=Ipomoea triloba TaxID=35885 RepID=UPI00125E5AB1|nr:pentatricopeptide repeat-containing protein At3g18110, chloroplastic-like [Ipomoea triloba]
MAGKLINFPAAVAARAAADGDRVWSRRLATAFRWGLVAGRDWGADFRKLSAGAALVGLTLWLDHMQVKFPLLKFLVLIFLRMWLKDSPFCLDLELKNRTTLSETNSMYLIEGCFVRRGLVPAYKDITERLGLVPPKKFSRLALLPDEKRERERVIKADIEGRKGKLAKSTTGIMRKKKITDFRKKRLLRRTHP